MCSTWEVPWLCLLGRDEAPQLGAVLRIEGYQRRLALQHGEEQLAAGQQRVAIQLAAHGLLPTDGAVGRVERVGGAGLGAGIDEARLREGRGGRGATDCTLPD